MDAAPFFCCCRVAAFGSQDLSFRTSINGHWVSGPRVSGPRYSALRTWVSRPRQAHARNALRESRARQKRDLRRVAALLDMSGIPFCRAGPELRHGRTDGRTLGFRTSSFRTSIFGSQDLGFKTSTGARTQRTPGVPGPGPEKTGSSPRSSAAGHERDPVLSGRTRAPSRTDGRTDGQGTLYIRFSKFGVLVPGLDLDSEPNSSSGLRNQTWFQFESSDPVPIRFLLMGTETSRTG